MYVPQTIIHRVSLGDYTTEIRAMKVPNKVANTAIATYISAANAIASNPNATSTNLANMNADLDALNEVDLTTVTNAAAHVPTSQTAKLTNTLLFQTDPDTKIVKGEMDATFAAFQQINNKLGN